VLVRLVLCQRRCGEVRCAVKEFSRSTLADETFKQEIEREAELNASLRNPFITTFFGSIKGVDRFCLVMEFAPEGSLGAMIKSGDVIPMDLKMKFAMDVAKGMDFLHRSHVLHRDLKADNVLVMSRDPAVAVCCKITDFGCSRFDGTEGQQMTKTKGVGTPTHMAPEILNNQKYSMPADVYSFAILLWNLFTQKEPYGELDTPWSMYGMVLGGQRPDLVGFDESIIPNHIKAIIEHCWDHDPTNRLTFSQIIEQLSN